MDLRALALRGAITHVTAADQSIPVEVREPTGQAWEQLLMAGCAIAQEMRAVLKVSLHVIRATFNCPGDAAQPARLQCH